MKWQRKVFQIFRGRAEARLCDLFRSAVTTLHKSHRLAKARFKGASVVMLSVGLCQSRKDPYLPLEPLSVRLLPRTNVLASSRFQPLFGKVCDLPKKRPPPPRSKIADGRFRVGDNLTVVPRPEGVLVGMYAMRGIFRLSPPDVLPVL